MFSPSVPTGTGRFFVPSGESQLKEKDNMQIYEELRARGLIAQVTDEEEIRELVNTGKAVFYIGFDPTADSLHVGDRKSVV